MGRPGISTLSWRWRARWCGGLPSRHRGHGWPGLPSPRHRAVLAERQADHRPGSARSAGHAARSRRRSWVQMAMQARSSGLVTSASSSAWRLVTPSVAVQTSTQSRQPHAPDHLGQVLLAQVRVDVGGAGLGAVAERVDSGRQHSGVDAAGTWIGVQHVPGVAQGPPSERAIEGGAANAPWYPESERIASGADRPHRQPPAPPGYRRGAEPGHRRGESSSGRFMSWEVML